LTQPKRPRPRRPVLADARRLLTEMEPQTNWLRRGQQHFIKFFAVGAMRRKATVNSLKERMLIEP
jgi:hypothetical protein